MIDYDVFYEWCKDRFGEENLKVRYTAHGVEICAPSPFKLEQMGEVDTGHNLWMNPSGGKSKHPDAGSFRCWVTDEQGSLVRFVARYDHVDFEEAEAALCSTSLRMLERKVHEFFSSYDEPKAPPPPPVVREGDFTLPDFCVEIDKIDGGNFIGNEAKRTLAKRKLPTKGLYVCVGGDYKNRIIIPYYDKDGKLIYFNGRTLSNKKDVLRYMKAPTEVVSQDNVLFMTDWARPGTKVFIMEGEFDAISVHLAGHVGCACGGKFLSETQIEMLRPYQPVLAFDSDNPGREALIAIGTQLLERGFPQVLFVRPPLAYKDWNELMKQKDIKTLRTYLDRNQKPFTSDTPALLLSQRI